MRRLDSYRLIALLGLLVGIAIAGGCADTCTEPDCCPPYPTLENIWPNEDQASWVYQYTYRFWDWSGFRIYPDADSVPPAPSMDVVTRLLITNGIGDNIQLSRGIYTLEFDGDTTTSKGVTAQNLRETLMGVDGRAPLSAGQSQIDPLLASLLIARPDLRDKIMEHTGFGADNMLQAYDVSGLVTRDLTQFLEDPLFIHGGPWEKTDEWIGSYGNIDTLLAWKFLDAGLSRGYEFTHQLIPGLTSDVFLHCRVSHLTDVETAAGSFGRALECIYMVDYGLSEILFPTLGWSRFFEYGTVVYVPAVGPVYSYRRMLVNAGKPTDTGLGDITLSLSAVDLPSD
jgi:hypothetical protein